MMGWFKPNIRNSLFGLLGNVRGSDTRLGRGQDEIREAMLGLLDASAANQFPQVVRRIRYAEDLQALWYLRGDLMAALAATRGESKARDMMASVTAQFQGLLPGGLSSRPSPLA
jgi:hypothetical protein